MENLKQEALNVITKMSEAATMDEIMYRLFVLDKVRKAREAIRRGETLSLEELENEMKSW